MKLSVGNRRLWSAPPRIQPHLKLCQGFSYLT